MSNERPSTQHDLRKYSQRHMELRHRAEQEITEARVLSIRMDPTFNKWLTAIVKTSTYGQTDVVRRLITASLNMLDVGMEDPEVESKLPRELKEIRSSQVAHVKLNKEDPPEPTSADGLPPLSGEEFATKLKTDPELAKFFKKLVEDVHREQLEKLKINPKASPFSMDNLEPIDLEEMSDLLTAKGYEVKKPKD